MDAFLDDLAGLLETAEAAARTNAEPDELTILVGPHGVRMVANIPGPLEAIRLDNGARAAYRITHRAGRVQVEGAASGRSGSLASTPRARLSFALFAGLPACQPALLRLESTTLAPVVAN